MELSTEFSRRIVELNGEAGAAWLEALPALLKECERSWDITLGPPFPLSYSYVAPATLSDGAEVVLKVGIPNSELHTEIAALRVYAGRAAVRLLDSDSDRGLLLLERAMPGTPLVELDDDEEATAIAADLMRELWQPAPSDHSFPTVADWAAGLKRFRARYEGGTGPLPARLVEIAEDTFTTLLSSEADRVVLHGDLHHWNILRAERRPWLAIDPKGVIGEPAYEVGALLRNPLPQLLRSGSARRTLARRVDLLAERLSVDRARLLGWGLAQAVLSAWWTIEDHGTGWEPAIAVAEILSEIDAEHR
jgi:streptomycin 6-kinase